MAKMAQGAAKIITRNLVPSEAGWSIIDVESEESDMRDLDRETDELKGLKTREGAEARIAKVAGLPDGKILAFAYHRKQGDWIAVAILPNSEMWRALSFVSAGVWVTNVL